MAGQSQGGYGVGLVGGKYRLVRKAGRRRPRVVGMPRVVGAAGPVAAGPVAAGPVAAGPSASELELMTEQEFAALLMRVVSPRE